MSNVYQENRPFADLYGEEVMNLLKERVRQDEELDSIVPLGTPDSFDRETGEWFVDGGADDETDATDEPFDSFADGEALASAGFGTDEDYGFYGDYD